MDLLDREIRLRIGIVADVRKHKAQIERGFAAVGRHFEHVVVARIDPAALDFLGAPNEFIDEALQLGTARRADGDGPALIELRHRQLEHLGGLHVSDLAELLHQLGNIHESREAALQIDTRCRLGSAPSR